MRLRLVLEPREADTVVTLRLTERVLWIQKLIDASRGMVESTLDAALVELRRLVEQG